MATLTATTLGGKPQIVITSDHIVKNDHYFCNTFARFLPNYKLNLQSLQKLIIL